MNKPKTSLKNIVVSDDTHSFLISEKYRWKFKSVDEYLKKKFPKITNRSDENE